MQGLPQKLGNAAVLVILPHQVSQHGQLPLILETGGSPYLEKKLQTPNLRAYALQIIDKTGAYACECQSARDFIEREIACICRTAHVVQLGGQLLSADSRAMAGEQCLNGWDQSLKRQIAKPGLGKPGTHLT